MTKSANEAQNSIIKIETSKLNFDPDNPRFYRLNDPSSVDSVIEEMLDDEGAQDLMQSIGQKGYFEGEPLLVAKSGDDCYIVIEGNRRLAATKLLNREIEPPRRRANSIEIIRNEAAVQPPTSLPCIIYEKRTDVLRYLGYRHITGVKEWDSLSKAKYLAQLRDEFYATESKDQQLKSLAKDIGSRADYVGKLLTALSLYTQAEDKEFFGLHVRPEDVEFSYLTTALNYKPITEWLGLEGASDSNPEHVKEDNLKRAFSWMFAKDQQGRTILGESRNLSDMACVVQSDHAVEVLERTGDLSEAYLYSDGPQSALNNIMEEAGKKLQILWNMLPSTQPLDKSHLILAEALSERTRDIKNYIRNKIDED